MMASATRVTVKTMIGAMPVTQNMLNQNPRSLGAGNDDRADIVLAVLGHDIGAYDTGNLRSVHKADGEDDRRHGVAQDGDEDGREGDARMDMMMSKIRMIVSETALRETAARAPTTEPQTRAMAVAPKPIISE